MQRARQLANLVNLSTALGLAVAAAGRAQLRRGPHGTLVATGYRLGLPRASAFTIGDVILTRMTAEQLRRRPRLVQHELRHCAQYACCFGPLMLPAYGLAAAWSVLRTGDPASRNAFERWADLADGGYIERPVRRLRRR